MKTVALWFPKKERTFATSLFNSRSNVGPIIAPIIIPWIALAWGWQMTFLAGDLLEQIPRRRIHDFVHHLCLCLLGRIRA
ncbi:MAG: MFS transporter [Verrucomicrobia bacterium]|nr:MFS transporter [Verrucomicrobiota bacterium]